MTRQDWKVQLKINVLEDVSSIKQLGAAERY
jgi:hypothetical protein